MKPRILVVDDDPSVLRALEKELQKSFDVTTCESIEDAEGILATSEDIVGAVVDFAVPTPADGYALIKAIRAHLPTGVCVLVTGAASDQVVRPLVGAGLLHCVIRKPWSEGEVERSMLEGLSVNRASS